MNNDVNQHPKGLSHRKYNLKILPHQKQKFIFGQNSVNEFELKETEFWILASGTGYNSNNHDQG